MIEYFIKLFTLEEILDIIEDDLEKETSEAGKRAKELITWNNFIRFFEKYAFPLLQDKFLTKLNQEDDQKLEEEIETIEDKIEIKPVYLLLLQDIFDAQKRISGDFVYTSDFVVSAKRDPQLKTILKEPARGASAESGLGKESLGEFLDRLVYEAPEKVRFKDLTHFLTRRGRPRDFSRLNSNKNLVTL